MCGVITTIIVLGGIAVLIARAADRMKSPSFTIDEATLTGYNLTSDNHLNATFSLQIRSHNPDTKYSIEYRAITTVVYLNHFGLAYDQNTLLGGPIAQAHGDDVIFRAQPTAQNALIPVANVAGELRSETKSGRLHLEVRVRARVRFEVKHWKHRDYFLKVICSPVVIHLSSGKTFQQTICDVDRF